MENGVTVYNSVCASLTVLQEIERRWTVIVGLDQENMKLEASIKENHKKKGSIFGGLAAFGTYIIWQLFARYLPLQLGMALIVSTVVTYFLVRNYVRKKHPLNFSEAVRNTEEINRLYNTLMAYSDENQELLECLPRDYRTLAAATFFEHALANGQAETMKEAISLFEEHQHRQNMENMTRQKLEQEQRNSAVLATIQANTAATAREAKSAAFWSMMNYLK